MTSDDMRSEVDRLRAQLAALREAAAGLMRSVCALPIGYAEIIHADEWDALDAALADTEAAAREHDARIRAQALRQAAERVTRSAIAAYGGQCVREVREWLHELADEAERGQG